MEAMNSSHVLLASLLFISVSCTSLSPDAAVVTAAQQEHITPDQALERLQRGNARFASGRLLHRNLRKQVHQTHEQGQHPFACVLSCIDSRTSSELIFDQGIGDIFNARVAGNVVSSDVLASLEYACQHAHAKLVAVIGHTKCGAVTGAVPSTKPAAHDSHKPKDSENLVNLIGKIKPALAATKTAPGTARTAENGAFVDQVAENNVRQSLAAIRQQSTVLREMEQKGTIKIVGGMYDTHDGTVTFLK